MTNTNLTAAKARLDEAEKAVQAARAEIAAIEQAGKEWPQVGDVFYLEGEFRTPNLPYSWDGGYSQKAWKERGLIHRTPEEAEAADKWRIVFAKYKAGAKGFVPDWENRNQKKWFVMFDHEQQELIFDWTKTYQYVGVIYFSSEEEVKAAFGSLTREEKEVLKGGPK